ncbi:MAG TPA: LytTR family DNA-binding domain-containing protein [Clostridia bacterium]
MIRVAIVEDNKSEADQLVYCLKTYEKEHNQHFHIAVYSAAGQFLDKNSETYDIVFFDIELPDLNGIKAAQILRSYDKNVVIIFITHMAQYAIQGYEVNALDYIVKPVTYKTLVFKIQKAIGIINANKEMELTVTQKGNILRISTSDLMYVEVAGHTLTYHLTKGVIKGRGTLSALEKTLKSRNFMRCNSCYLVNPRFIEYVKGYDIFMLNGDRLKISQPKKKKFMEEFANWLGQGNN